MSKFQTYFQNHAKLRKAAFFVNVILVGGILFPFGNSLIPFSLWIVGFIIASAGFITIYGKNKEELVYITSLILTGLGLIFRYFLEYGEVLSSRSFTMFNIVSYLVVMPIITVIAYYLLIKYGMKKK